MPRISRYNHDEKRLEWVDASQEEYDAWLERRRAGSAASGKRSHKRKPATLAAGTERLEMDSGPTTQDKPSLSGANRTAKGTGRKPSPGTGPLTPVIGLVSRLFGIGVSSAAQLLTGSRHPMTPAEAMSIGAPAARILNRELGKRIKWVPSAGGEYSAELERIGTGLASWVLRGIANATGQAGMQPAQPGPATQFVRHATEPEPPPFNLGMAEPAPDSVDDGADLFSGSEPVSAGGAAVVGASGSGPRPVGAGMPVDMGARASGPAGALSVPDSVWNNISPPEMGMAGAMPRGG